jgi:hypothetical protein
MLALVGGRLFAQVEPPPQEEPSSPPKLLAEFDMPRDGSLVTVPVTFDGQTYRFLVDTGSRFTTFDASFAPKLGKLKGELEGRKASGEETKIRIFYAPQAKLGPLDMQFGGQVICLDLTELRDLSGLDVQGVIGMGMLRRYGLQFDIDAGKLRFYEPFEGAQPQWGEPVALRLQDATPMVVGTFGEKYRTIFAIHTGYEYGGAMGRRLFDSLRQSKVITKVTRSMLAETLSSGEGNDGHESLAARVNDLRIGPFTHNGLIFDRSRQVSSLLGMGWLSRYNATFDFRNSRLYLNKSHRFDAVDQMDMSGLHLIQHEKGAEVHAVDPDSPASKAGIKAGDIILKLDEQWVVKMPLAETRKLLRSGDGKTLTVIFQRGEQGYRTPLTLKQQI